MQLFVLIAVALVLVADGAAPVGGAIGAGFLGAALAAWIPPALIAIGCAVVVRRARSLLAAPRDVEARSEIVRRADRRVRLLQWLALPAFAVAIFAFGWVAAVRGLVGNTILVDELVALLPPMVAATAAWWCWYPLERRLRELERKALELDLAAYAGAASGPPSAALLGVPEMPSRLAYVAQQVRVHLLLLLAPMLAALALAEATRSLLRWGWPAAPPWTADVGAAGAVAALFVASPWLVRLVLDTHRMPDGPLRRELLEVCRRHRVRVSELLVWRTRGSMLNGAVVGLVPWLRYVLLTDALIDVLPREQLVAVMAHEVGHVRRRHMLVSALGLLACAALGSFAVDGAVAALRSSVPVQPGDAGGPSEWIDLGGMVVAAALTLVGFGVVSRRLERQADTFAVAHLSSSSDRMVLPAAVDAMCGALAAVSSSSGVDPGRRSYRHGSIASRQAYLRSIEGAPTQGLAIDRQVRWMTLASAIIVAVALALSW